MIDKNNYSNTIFKNNLKYLTNKYKITQKELEEKLEMGNGILSRYINEKNVIEPKVGTLDKIAKYFGIKIDDLIHKDLQNLEIESINSKNDSEYLFVEKILKETIEGVLVWEELNFFNHHYIRSKDSDETYNWITNEFIRSDSFKSNWLENSNTFKSMFFYKEYELKVLEGYTCIIDLNYNTEIQLVIIRYLDEQIDNNYNYIYEFYFINEDEKVIPSCCSHKNLFGSYELDYSLDDLLRKLYNLAPNSEKEKIYMSYLNKVNL